MRSLTRLGLVLGLGLVSSACRGEGGASMLGDDERAVATPDALSTEDDGDDGDDGEEVRIALADVPAHVRLAAEAAVPGIALQSAEREHENGRVVYGLEGTADGERVEVEVAANGEVLEIERADDDGDDGDDD